MLEKDIENIIAKYPNEFFPNEGFKLVTQQYSISGKRFDLLFIDKYNRQIIIEIKKGVLSREASGQIAEYYGLLKQKDSTKNIELILCANIIPHERRSFLETIGISCKEISEEKIIEITKKYNENITTENEPIHIQKKEEISVNLSPRTLNDFYEKFKLPGGKELIDFIDQECNKTGYYKGRVRNKGVFYSYGFFRIDGKKESLHYSYILNKYDLLFYIRKPGENNLKEKGLLEKITDNFHVEIKNKKQEITIRINSKEQIGKILAIVLKK